MTTTNKSIVCVDGRRRAQYFFPVKKWVKITFVCTRSYEKLASREDYIDTRDTGHFILYFVKFLLFLTTTLLIATTSLIESQLTSFAIFRDRMSVTPLF